jgi:hypothetical protein
VASTHSYYSPKVGGAYCLKEINRKIKKKLFRICNYVKKMFTPPPLSFGGRWVRAGKHIVVPQLQIHTAEIDLLNKIK